MESLRNGMGSWHTRAKTIWELQQMGFTAEQLYDVALVTAHLQTAMVVASKVYDSLVLAQASSELLSALESNETHVCSLYELRILSSKQRKAAAEYVVEKGLDTKGAEELARAIKQHERRAELREGFSPLPGDCLALMHYRAAKESSQADEKQSLAQRALEFAVSEAAVEKISKLLQNVFVGVLLDRVGAGQEGVWSGVVAREVDHVVRCSSALIHRGVDLASREERSPGDDDISLTGIRANNAVACSRSLWSPSIAFQATVSLSGMLSKVSTARSRRS
ncbi:hypothetical protein SELMODRAFT_412999 [Selaginella moellendorffii]|uniref:Uncharacterized protein n=1 Tax=Selaginella moellendorffii TaxID=88036 RepID=D8RN09_SELML|nr:hypothetical protein SELMODRAFT_412999 [Selaginella moellendorffii]